MTELRVLWVLLVLAIAYTGEAIRIGVGELAKPGSGLYPTLVGVAIALTCALRLITLRFGRRAPSVEEFDNAGSGDTARTPWTVAGLMGVLIGFGLLQNVIGFVPALAVALFAALRITGYATWPRCLAVACAAATIALVVFQWWLKVPFPKGMVSALVA